MPSPAEKRLARSELIAWISEPRYTHAITLSPDRKELSLASLRKMFGAFCLDVDRMKLGKHRVSRVPTLYRFDAIAFPEHLQSNAHLHIAANFDPRYWSGRKLDDASGREMEQIWKRITHGSGKFHLQPARDKGWAKYITKEMYRESHDYFLAADFHPNDKVLEYPKVREALDALWAA